MKFDFVIGNPPYQQDAKGSNENDTPLYHYFYDAAFDLADKVELITPARFLANAGGTPKKWNEKMLEDKHLKILSYTQNSDEIFKNTDIKGGVVITYRDTNHDFGAIKVFTTYKELRTIKEKVETNNFQSLSEIVSNRGLYRFSEEAFRNYPELNEKLSDSRISTFAFSRLEKIFSESKPNDNHEYIQLYGNYKSERVYRWIRKDFVKDTSNLYCYKVIVPKANGSGALGETLSTPLVIGPFVGFTETYISIGETSNKDEANAILKYIKTKFARTLLGVLKITQDNAKPKWKYVPIQDFSNSSDIDWKLPITEIDKQLYKKYKLNEEEIKFIEKNVKEMV